LPSFRVSAIASVCCFAGVSAGMVALPFYLQHELGQSALMAGLYLTPWPVTVAILAPIAGHLADRVPTAWLCVAGAACLAVGLAGACLWPLHGHPEPLALFTAVCGLGFGLFNVPNNRNMFLASPRERAGAVGGLQGMARLIGQTSGAVMMTLLFTVTAAGSAPRLGLAIGAVLALSAGLVSAIRA
jgi:DHA2 family multidrug resistance protein-like MFS transporter